MSESTSDPERRQPLRERSVSRRGALRALGRGVAVSSAATAMSAPAAAREVSAFVDAKPNAVEITTDDTEFLDYYRPILDTRHVPYDNQPTLYGWKCTSRDSDVETDVAVYACEYAVQKDVIKLTSHPGDHEWVYVFVDSDTGEVSEVSYTAYHWLRGYLLNPPVYGEDGGAHPMFTVAPTYHNYLPDSAPVSDSSVLLDVNPLGDYSSASGPVYQWLANGLKADMEPGAVHNPWILDSDGPLDAWWREDVSGVNKWILDAWTFLAFSVGVGIAGSKNANFGDAEPPS